ncbi:MAG: DUF58 domain-containing protein [Planctomycetota bacterium]|nr:MAG: DUF58 domain-containing protein [Planctomycetota bacterium]
MSEASDLEREEQLAELLEEVRRILVLSKRLVAEMMAGGYVSAFRGSGIEFDEVREFVDGDDPRSIDWNVTARTGRPFIKKFIDERERTVINLVDISASMDAGFSFWSLREVAARVCACLSLSAVQNDDKVGLACVSSELDAYVPPRKGMGHVLRIVRDCLVQPGSGQPGDLGAGLEFVSRVLRKHAIVFVISDFLGEGWREALSRCSQRHDVVAVRLLPPELEIPKRGLLRVRDPETGQACVLDFAQRKQREFFGERVRDWRRRCDEDLGRCRVDIMDVEVPREADLDAIARPILDFFRMRAARGSKR